MKRILVIIGILKILVLNMNHIFAMLSWYNEKKYMNFNDAAIVSVKRSDYRIDFQYMCKDDAINTKKNSNLNEKIELLQIFFITCKSR